jgi:hypothetical protein
LRRVQLRCGAGSTSLSVSERRVLLPRAAGVQARRNTPCDVALAVPTDLRFDYEGRRTTETARSRWSAELTDGVAIPSGNLGNRYREALDSYATLLSQQVPEFGQIYDFAFRGDRPPTNVSRTATAITTRPVGVTSW